MASRFKPILSDSLTLFQSILSKSQGKTYQEILVKQASNKNTVATSFLLVQKEVNLLRYHGLENYLKQHARVSQGKGVFWERFRTILYGISPADEDTVQKDRAAAKIPFMITAAQKLQLEEMGYVSDHIQKLTPMEAVIVIQHGLSPLEKERLRVLKQEMEQEMQKPKEQLTETDTLMDRETRSFREEMERPKEQQHKLDETTDQPITSNQWYEVLETNPETNTESVVALYRDETEARACVDIKAEFATRKQNGSLLYRVRRR